MATTKRKRKTLAHVKKLSTLLAIGLRDLRRQERAKNSRVDMGCWLYRPTNGPCTACLAGSVMRFTLNRLPEIGGTICGIFSDKECDKRIDAISCLAFGKIASAARYLNVCTIFRGRTVPKYGDDKEGWWKSMKLLLSDLRKAGE